MFGLFERTPVTAPRDSLDIGMQSAPPPDYEGRRGMERLAAKLTDYWHSRGHTDASFWVVQMHSQREAFKFGGVENAIYEIRSNLVNGLPPSARRKK